jgi:chromosome segregation ATPase
MTTVDEGKSCVALVQRLVESTLPQTGIAGQQQLNQQLKTMRDNWNEAQRLITALQSELEDRLHTWNDLDQRHGELIKWLKDIDVQIASIEIQATLKEKQQQSQKLVVIVIFFLLLNYVFIYIILFCFY